MTLAEALVRIDVNRVLTQLDRGLTDTDMRATLAAQRTIMIHITGSRWLHEALSSQRVPRQRQGESTHV